MPFQPLRRTGAQWKFTWAPLSRHNLKSISQRAPCLYRSRPSPLTDRLFTFAPLHWPLLSFWCTQWIAYFFRFRCEGNERRSIQSEVVVRTFVSKKVIRISRPILDVKIIGRLQSKKQKKNKHQKFNARKVLRWPWEDYAKAQAQKNFKKPPV